MDSSNFGNAEVSQIPSDVRGNTSLRQNGATVVESGVQTGDLESNYIDPDHQTFSPYLGHSLPVIASSSNIEASLSNSQGEAPLNYYRSAL
jgi:hypothetical protein